MGMLGGGLLAVAAILWGLFVTIIYMVCAWRAMRAHEKLARSIDVIARKYNLL